ncbi:hypothetical protein ES319_D11G096900v1 [Gossypium barbadense]|uniref:acyl-CoA hydrolase n=2 Tax=Gossypium TaxID=3633 RepID=A0A5J5P8T8_GOSBA|nr:hypothetical protein ES319_D11G096900v1 [Gossypium barbadense]TYG44502.1 hypothetical protein ES288_D11G101900v1 [Gossypium darwinii]
MNSETVIEFLGNVPLLQRLPSSVFKRIADVVKFKHFEKGDYVVREGEVGDGIYFVWEGEAEVSGSVHAEEENRLEYQLKRYDYFGHVNPESVHVADIIALTKLTCLFLPHEHCTLLQSKSIWSTDKTTETCALVESILHLEPIELNIFQGITLPDAPKFGKVFGGQFVGQALAAASKTVDSLKIVHSLHSYFLMVGDFNIPIIYQVNRLRDGRNFATRRVDAIQKGNIVFTLLASFQKEEEGFDHQEAMMPSVPAPDRLLSLDELRELRLTDPRLPMSYRKKVATTKFVPWPIEIRFCAPNTNTNQTKSDPSLRYWFRAKGKLSDDQALHRCVVAFASDLIFSAVSLNPHRRKGFKSASLSLDHSMWFHRHLRADDWLLFVIVSPTASVTRGFVSGQMFNRKGELVVSLTQEALLRMARPPKPATVSKL